MHKPPLMLVVCLSVGVLLSGLQLKAGEEDARIDWQKNMITAIGVASIRMDYNGTPVNAYDETPTSINEARRISYDSAKNIALEKITALLKDVRVTQDETVGSLLAKDSFTRKKLYDVFENAQVDHFPTGFESSGCRVKMHLGEIMNALPFTFPSRDFPERTDTPIETSYTGIIIDSRGFETKPMMFPVIYNKNGLEIVSRHNINAAQAMKYGMVTYAANESEAKKNRRLGARPLYIVAIDENRGCPVLSEKDARRMFSSRKTAQAIKECRIVFIIDKE